VFEQDIALIESTLRLLNEEDFDRAVGQILTAKTVYVLGEKSSFALAYFLYFRLSRLGIDCKLIHFGGPAVFSELAPLKKGDVLLAIGFRMIPYEVCGAVKLAKAKRATVIAITSPPISPIAVPADIVLYVDRGNAEKIQSVTGGIVLCHAIVIGVAARLGKRSTAILKEIDAAERARAEFTPEDYRV
jgi:DNA-binding MurR/RpiR family transcriptional regulator